MTKILSAAAEVQRDLDELRDNIFALKQEHDRIAMLPDDPATIEARVDQEIAAALQQAPLRFGGLARQGASDLTLSGYFRNTFEASPLTVFAALMPERLKQELLARLPSDGIKPEDRRQQLQKIESQLDVFEIAEEIACREIDAAMNTMVVRRADARPEILLAPDHELNGGAAA